MIITNHARLKGLLLAGAAALTMLSAPALAVAQDHVQSFDIPAEDGAAALNDFARQAGVQIVFPYDAVQGRRAPAVKGHLTRAQALAALAAALNLEVTSDANGVVTLSAPRVRSSAAEPITQVAELVVTGSRLGRAADGPATVISFDKQAIVRSGATQVRDVLKLLPQASTSFDESGTLGFIGAAPPQLRGLSAGSTLLLLNGRRLNVSGAQFASDFFDLNQIPLAAVERVEVLTDTATAVYGADAVGGAINLLLKRDFRGLEVSSRVGTSYEGDASERQAALVAGGESGRFSGLLVASWFERDPVTKDARAFTANSDFTRFGGPDLRSALGYPGTVYSLDGQPLPGLNSSFAGIPANTTGAQLTPGDFAATDGVLSMFEPAPFVTLVPETHRQSVYGSGSIELTPDAQLYGELLYSHVRQVVQAAPDALFGGQFGVFVVSADNPYNPFGVDVGVDHRFVDLGPRITDADTDFMRWTVGARGKLPASFDYDLSYWRDSDHTTILNQNYVDYAKVFTALASTDPAMALNVFTGAGNSPQVLESIRGDRTDRFRSAAQTAELVVRGPLLDLPAGPLRIALGGDLRRERLEVSAPGIIEIEGDRDSGALFAEADIPLVSPEQGLRLVERLEATAAVRYDGFSGGVETTNPQLGLLWGLTSAFSLRATYGEAFKIPSLYNLFSPSLQVNTVVLDPLRGNEAADVLLRVGGNNHIEPETAQSWTAGFSWSPDAGVLQGAKLRVSFFHIEQKNFVQSSLDSALVLSNPDIFPDRIVRADPTANDIAAGRPGRLLEVDARAGNLGQVTVQGVDLDAGYRWSTERLGDFGVQVLASYIDSYKLQLLPTAPAQDVVDIANLSGFPIDLKLTSILSWTGRSGLGASLTARYRDSYKDYDGVRTLPAQTLFDAQLSYDGTGRGAGLTSNWSGRLGVVNLTNEQADFANSFVGYDPAQTDMRGRFFYVELAKRF
jgi:iron complex outermembrane receptor protein